MAELAAYVGFVAGGVDRMLPLFPKRTGEPIVSTSWMTDMAGAREQWDRM